MTEATTAEPNAPVAAKAPPTARKIPAVLDNRLQGAEFVKVDWCLSAEAGTTIEDILRPEYWAHVATKLRPDAKICVYTEDRAFYAELIVLQVSRVDARVAMILHKDLTDDLRAIDMGNGAAREYEVKWGSPASKYRVIRKSDKEVICSGLASIEAGWAWLHQSYLPNIPKGN